MLIGVTSTYLKKGYKSGTPSGKHVDWGSNIKLIQTRTNVRVAANMFNPGGDKGSSPDLQYSLGALKGSTCTEDLKS